MHCARVIDARPGQFIQLRCKRMSRREASDSQSSAEPLPLQDAATHRWADGPVLLPRPFSLAGLKTAADHCELEIIYRVVGPGTTWMVGLEPGDRVQALGPLGNHFELGDKQTTAYVVGGGVGLPPMIWLAEWLRAADRQVVAFCGARTAKRMALSIDTPASTDATRPNMAAEEFARHGTPVVLTTDDGTLGVKGLVNDALDAYHTAYPCPADEVIVYACGPEPMMRAVAQWCMARNICCQVCMERMMACGVGTCQSCAVAVHDEAATDGYVYKLCCTDGPVFDARDVVWEQAVPRSAYTPPY